MKRKLSKTALSFVLSLAATSAFAHEPTTGPNGGVQVDAGAYHAELVADGTAKVALYLSDANGNPVPAAGFKANAIFIVDGKPQRFALIPNEGSKFLGEAAVPFALPAKGAVQLTAPDGQTGQAKF